MDDFKSEIQKIEAEILAVTGTDIEEYNEWAESESVRNRVESLLKCRCKLLNESFQLTVENLERLCHVNSHLTNLTKRAHDRIGDIGAVEYYMADCEDDGYDVESHVRFIYLGDESVLKLDDDDYYGSNFTLMIKALTELYIAKGLGNIIYARDGKNNLDDGESWLEEPFCKWKHWLGVIIICYAVHDLTCHKSYSIPDLLRLDSFLCESVITFQRITRQNGSRFKA